MFSIPELFVALRKSVAVRPTTLLQIRTFKSDLKIKWIRPEKISCIDPKKSGDLKPSPSIDMEILPAYFEKCEELKNASDTVKRLFTLGYAKRKCTMNLIRDDMVKNVRRHSYDQGSFESRIAKMTAAIRNLQDAYSKAPYNRRMKVGLKELIDKRKKFLKYLRRRDYKKFEWLLEKLDLQYKPPPSHFHWITRKESLQKLTDKYCEDLKNERLEAYKEQLESQKFDFLTEKIKKLTWIIEEEKACGVTPSFTQNDIDKVTKQLEELKVKKQVDTKEKAEA